MAYVPGREQFCYIFCTPQVVAESSRIKLHKRVQHNLFFSGIHITTSFSLKSNRSKKVTAYVPGTGTLSLFLLHTTGCCGIRWQIRPLLKATWHSFKVGCYKFKTSLVHFGCRTPSGAIHFLPVLGTPRVWSRAQSGACYFLVHLSLWDPSVAESNLGKVQSWLLDTSLKDRIVSAFRMPCAIGCRSVSSLQYKSRISQVIYLLRLGRAEPSRVQLNSSTRAQPRLTD